MQFALYVHPVGHVQATARNRKGETLVYQTFWENGVRRFESIKTLTFDGEAARRRFSRDARQRQYRKVASFATGCVRPDSNEFALKNLLSLLDYTRMTPNRTADGYPTLGLTRAVLAMYSYLLDPAHFPYSGLVLFDGEDPAPHFNF